MSKLKIYKASAGSGKTFKLTEEYILLLFKNPNDFKHTLAVTFTNKATEEMKSRIIGELYKLSIGSDSPYLPLLITTTKLEDKAIAKKAKDILERILHNYGQFSISTIDSFFQRIVRSFTKEIGLQTGFALELDSNKVLNEAIDRLFMDVGKNKQLTEWLTRFAENRVQDGSNWNFKNDLAKLGNEIFTEKFKSFDPEFYNQLNDKQYIETVFKEINEVKVNFENHLSKIGEKALKLMDEYELTIDDFSYKKAGVAGYFNKIYTKESFEPSDRPKKALGDPSKWYPKDSKKKTEIENIVNDGLDRYLGEAIDYYMQENKTFETALAAIDSYYSIGLLIDLISKIREYRNDNNLFLMNDLAIFLKGIIDDNDTPYIYEKAGNSFKHFMIDEFQDTSGFQWSNFKPLIINSLSQGYTSLIVGDVKQSIYRWRNGDWRLLLTQVPADISHIGVEDFNLETNWRSKENVINFNNALFVDVPKMLETKLIHQIAKLDNYSLLGVLKENLGMLISKAYSESAQKVPDNKAGGYIQIAFFESEEGQDWKHSAREELIAKITILQNAGYEASDIALLVRKKLDGKEIADYLMQYKKSDLANPTINYDVISQESLYLGNSPSVRIIISSLKYLNNSTDLINKAELIYEYTQYIEQDNNGVINFSYINYSYKDYLDKNAVSDKFQELMPEDFIKLAFYSRRLPLYELVEQLLNIFRLTDRVGEFPYIQTFQDVMLEYTKVNSTDSAAYLDWWEEFGQFKSVTISEKQNAMRIMTIHQSKGLQFKAVIIPYCDWKIDNDVRKTNLLWCKTETSPFNKLKYLPIKYSDKLVNTHFAEDYFDEMLQAYMDNLNMLYVANTRAEEVLIIFAPLVNDKNTEGIDNTKLISDVMYLALKNEGATVNTLGNWNERSKQFIMGEIIPKSKKEKINEINPNQLSIAKFASYNWRKRISIKNHSHDYFTEMNPANEEKLNYGTLMHELISKINTLADIDRELNAFIMQGKVSQSQAERTRKKLDILFDNSIVADWFSGNWNIFKEKPILLAKSGKIKRPDRVMFKDKHAIVVDFKFGDELNPSYNTQVLEYMQYLEEMDYSPVEGYLLYGGLNKLVQVNR